MLDTAPRQDAGKAIAMPHAPCPSRLQLHLHRAPPVWQRALIRVNNARLHARLHLSACPLELAGRADCVPLQSRLPHPLTTVLACLRTACRLDAPPRRSDRERDEAADGMLRVCAQQLLRVLRLQQRRAGSSCQMPGSASCNSCPGALGQCQAPLGCEAVLRARRPARNACCADYPLLCSSRTSNPLLSKPQTLSIRNTA